MADTSVLAPSPGVPRAAINTGAGLWSSSLVVAGRMVRKFVRTPQLIVFTAIQSALFLLMFRYGFGGAINTGGSLSYVKFMVPGFIARTVLWAGMGAATMQPAPTGAPTTLLAIEATNIPAAAVWPIRSRLRDDLLCHLVRG